MTFNITRENYHPLTIESFENSLKLANGEINVTVANGTNQNTISDSFLTFLERLASLFLKAVNSSITKFLKFVNNC